jgi:hypothetical protein
MRIHSNTELHCSLGRLTTLGSVHSSSSWCEKFVAQELSIVLMVANSTAVFVPAPRPCNIIWVVAGVRTRLLREYVGVGYCNGTLSHAGLTAKTIQYCARHHVLTADGGTTDSTTGSLFVA